MELKDYMNVLENIGACVFSTVNEDGEADARYANVGVANEHGVFFMTAPTTNFYKQLTNNPKIAITGMLKEDGIEVIRLQGTVREIGKEHLEAILKDNPFVQDVYPDEEERATVQAFQLYEGEGSYQHLQNHVKEEFSFSE
ncbi:pyridoxamine 5'-phosphate oxidase family protein [Aerococcus mictus]|uniref:Pyridoxamine 5'-phosphate oxidase family protein n=2 Tax=Aerococcaceae TaxID=186827 RepID=A0ABZ2EAA9_9LACT|nr:MULTISPECIES: pyridoxamine 5'-phosphate oxidase family protein [Aerococcus]MDK6597450.1 pyridoxamine 5'-phosphate oxidase family protein [Aerococcus urinae]MDK7303394.1 pyridoxamine 5'-phosphate oxidase family protein [Aerococcus urinae]MDL5174884.1 pyridoxamine 5'-phosphate oxidase family protein [Aerococcus mictus]RAV69920.1 pyridoxamine 5'-phosphate oxidase family protein [Aerococcus urinae]RAW04174.1 pyridoxamine 5'-phosphate oxidase family protein [Aerococcus urinae]